MRSTQIRFVIRANPFVDYPKVENPSASGYNCNACTSSPGREPPGLGLACALLQRSPAKWGLTTKFPNPLEGPRLLGPMVNMGKSVFSNPDPKLGPLFYRSGPKEGPGRREVQATGPPQFSSEPILSGGDLLGCQQAPWEMPAPEPAPE